MLRNNNFRVSIVLSFLLLFTACSITIDVPANTKSSDIKSETNEQLEQKEQFDEDQEEYLNEFLNKEVPDLKMKNLEGNLVDIKNIEGPFLLTFSRVKCPSCVDLYSTLLELKSDNINVVDVYYRDSKDDIFNMLTDIGFDADFSLLSGIEDVENNTVMDVFKLIAVPTTFFINYDKVVTHIEIGSFDTDIFYDSLFNYLN